VNTVQAWKLDRTLTFGVVIALAVQSAGALIWAGGAGERLDQMERRLDDQGALSTPVAERLARLEEHALHTRASLDRIEQRLANQARPGEPPDG
jgi:hypothetical protein